MLLAKSEKQGGLTLLEHTQHVVQAIEVMAVGYGYNVAWAQQGGILHDLGKGHPAFQAMLIEKPRDRQDYWLERLPAATAIKEELFNRSLGRSTPRHEISSLLFLPLFAKEEWPVLIDMVVAHHKSITGSRGLIGLLKACNRDAVFTRHAKAWEEWSPVALEVAAQFGVSTHSISLHEAEEAFAYVVQYVEAKPNGWSAWRGVLMAADHFASAYMAETASVAANLFQVPDLQFYEARTQTERAALYPLTQVAAEHPAAHTLVIAPTGAGKTDFLLRRCCGRVFYTLPFQASINAMYERILEDLGDADVRRLHAASRIELPNEAEEDAELQRHPGASVKVMTPHQLAAVVFGTPSHEAIALDLRGQDIILDEVHTYNDQARAMVVQIVRTLVQLGCRVHIGTATIPTALAHVLVEALGGPEHVYEVRLPDVVQQSFNRHVVYKIADEAAACAIIQDAVAAGEHVLFVSNRVDQAQMRYRWAHETFGDDVPMLLVHSRFKRRERAALEQQIKQYQDLEAPCVVCATQVLEVSLDISYDRMVTDAAPLDSLIQRFGRVNRKRTAETIGHYKPIHVIAPAEEDKAILPYDAATVRGSYDALPNGEVLDETTVQARIDRVYPDITVQNIQAHFVQAEDGAYTLKELAHNKRSVIVEALDIDSYAAITQSDLEAYTRARWDERSLFEIPIPSKSTPAFCMQNRNLVRLDYGAYPYVVPDIWYHPDGLPLGLVVPPKETDDARSRFL